MIVFDSDDFACNHIISDQCQSHDCRDVLLEWKKINPKFKATLFAIPNEMTPELLTWSADNIDWVELAYHGFTHYSNYECEKLEYKEVDELMNRVMNYTKPYFVKGFKAPGWQISDDIYKWLLDNGWWVADQSYNNDRRPKDLPAYINDNGKFGTYLLEPNGTTYFHEIPNAIHTHTWNCVGNGVYELFDEIAEKIKDETDFKFVSEVV